MSHDEEINKRGENYQVVGYFTFSDSVSFLEVLGLMACLKDAEYIHI